MESLKYGNGSLSYLDQTQLPGKEIWKECKDLDHGFKAILDLEVRGAPLIGVFAAYTLVVHMNQLKHEDYQAGFIKAAKYLQTARPTAVNLNWAIERMLAVFVKNSELSFNEMKNKLEQEAVQIHYEDKELCRKIAENGLALINSGDRILTHCNAGFLATGGIGTALGVIYKAHETYGNISVFADETRPLLQGARLTSWELDKAGVPVTLITDNMAGFMMKQGRIDKIIVGADRIAANGDTANKIGTYSVAVLARYHHIPFFVAAPYSSFDLSLQSGADIPIEERSGHEVKNVLGHLQIAPERVAVKNPAFDVTPGELVSAIITDKGVFKVPYDKEQFQAAFQ